MCTESALPAAPRVRQRGLSLIELIIFMVIVSVGVVGLVSVIASLTRGSADPMVRKQMMAIAESVLREAADQPFTYCDPADVNAATASSTAQCTGGAAASQDKGGGALSTPSPTNETRYNAPQFNNVADYGGFSKLNIDDITGNFAMAGYTASVAVARAGGDFGLADAGAALRVTVTVSHAGQDDYSLSTYRFRYAPRAF
ncbi:type II secretion system protein [Rhodocyclus tenuis]|uniref:Type II secretion system protein n=1 Tax=Rhodocyclus gracilis TaxID=2929842 RepID=A0ABX0WFS2_9RHOO|nr:prepilin-type N-terminal cleavage/methylation domain-containing protein [Rhodocyclus gracilis]NJA88220.1 type II secretion system protein [Rhodocyclus gracilis]